MRRWLLVCLAALLMGACGGTPAPQAGTGDDASDPTVPSAREATSTDGDQPEGTAVERTASEARDGETADGGVLAFTVPMLDGGQLDASTLEGRDVVLWFWAPW